MSGKKGKKALIIIWKDHHVTHQISFESIGNRICCILKKFAKLRLFLSRTKWPNLANQSSWTVIYIPRKALSDSILATSRTTKTRFALAYRCWSTLGPCLLQSICAPRSLCLTTLDLCACSHSTVEPWSLHWAAKLLIFGSPFMAATALNIKIVLSKQPSPNCCQRWWTRADWQLLCQLITWSHW